ncbi:ESX secretion-associated protein EspG [Amycolatopsis sp. BJA-103]|uniref:ESX secretion-associated protein EspG n=1 Tax=unclassified Amycolatopsis TaxID=2618356 RepID=UPI000CA2F564|nr:ESX secretion-associated protein EspG [Amycolatopsis sp. BJA-103]AUI57039.1 hypothetical protein BKN51_01660 [Amycolatopsis sp. BJA-103]PNE15315.1 hypothetical protein B1H26_30030 [Amycolatopsis sp. BJA-103]
MSVIERAVVVPRLAFLTAWTMLDLGDPPSIFGTGRHFWMEDGFRRELDGKTLEWLADHGLARRGRLNPLWTDSLRVIATAATEFYGWSHYKDDSRGAILVAIEGTDAVRVLADADTVTVQPVAAKWPATSLLDCLPELDGAPVRTVAVEQAFYDNPDTTPVNPLAEPVDTRDVDYLAEVMRRPRDAAHQLYTARREGDGHRVRSSPISAIDLTGQGRVLTYVTGEGNIALTSGTPREIIVALNDTAAGLRA